MVFYFTGTGNSLYVARELDGQTVSIPQAIRKDDLTFSADKIGIVCPIYGHEMPAMVKEFIRRATFQTEYFYVVLTYGNMHGGAAEIADKVLKDAGITADYITTVLMVDNFLPAFDMNKQTQLDKQVEKQIVSIRSDISQRRRGIQKASFKDRITHKMYLKMVKNQPETVWAAYRVSDECIACGICANICPGGCIRLENGKAVHHLENCQACMACVHACPKLAIQFTIKEVNPQARYRNPHISLEELIAANGQAENRP